MCESQEREKTTTKKVSLNHVSFNCPCDDEGEIKDKTIFGLH
jgi:hypothetical protein